jgi:tetratricopeptide (TPR) repeat protein
VIEHDLVSESNHQLAREFPNSSAPKLQNGELMRRQKNYKEAESIFRGLYEKDRSDLVALTRLMDTYYEQGKYDAAIQYLTRESAGNSSSAQIRDLLADAALRGKNLDLAVKQYAAKANAEPGNAMAHLKLGDAYLQKGNVKDAITQFETARKLAPRDAMVNAMLALSFRSQPSARQTLSSCFELAPA